MRQIQIDGIVGFDVMAKDIRAQLDESDGDIELIINSPGGSVTEGIAVYNALKDYKRNNKGQVTARVVGMAGSMATYIPMAADRIAVEENAVWMIHNPWSFGVGDQRRMRKLADMLESLSTILARAYAGKTKKDMAQVRTMMDDETYLYGQQIVDAGFATELLESDEETDESEAVAFARLRVDELGEKLKERVEDAQQIAALVKELEPKPQITIGVADQKPAERAKQHKESAMDIKALEMEHPDVFAQAVQIGESKERDRVKSLRSYIDADPDNVKVRAVVEEAIGAGQNVSDINAKLQVAIRDGRKEAGENPPVVASAHESGPSLTDEERQMCRAMGLSEADYIKYGKEAR